MKLTAEISLYPLSDEYLDVVKEFVRALRKHDGLTLVTNAMSTQVCGDYDRVFDAVSTELRESVNRRGKQVLVCKFIVGELDIKTHPDF
ncbi:MAG: YkoF family thiamine/hydroxymethylpyrimidine-binding protein [Gammaproteobacteria bacterium]